jgi:hypothetical protein
MNIVGRWTMVGMAAALLGTLLTGARPAPAAGVTLPVAPRPIHIAQIPNLTYTDWNIYAKTSFADGAGLRIVTEDANGNFAGYFYPKGYPAVAIVGTVSAAGLSEGNPISFTIQYYPDAVVRLYFNGKVYAANPSYMQMEGTVTVLDLPTGIVRGPYPFVAVGRPTIQ